MTDKYYLQRSSQKLQIAAAALFSFAISNQPISDFSAIIAGEDKLNSYLFLLHLVSFLLAFIFSLLGCWNAIQSFRALEPYRWKQGKLLIGNYVVLLVCLLVFVANGLAVWRLWG